MGQPARNQDLRQTRKADDVFMHSIPFSAARRAGCQKQKTYDRMQKQQDRQRPSRRGRICYQSLQSPERYLRALFVREHDQFTPNSKSDEEHAVKSYSQISRSRHI